MKYSLKRIDLQESSKEILRVPSEYGYILVSSFNQDLSYPEITRNAYKLKKDIDHSGYNYIPVWMEIFERSKKVNVKIQVFVIVNSMRGTSKGFEDDISLRGLGSRLCREYNMDAFGYVRQNDNSTLYFIDSSNRELLQAESRLPAKDVDYFLHFLSSPSKNYLCRRGIVWLANAPKSLAEAYKRMGEIFFRIN